MPDPGASLRARRIWGRIVRGASRRREMVLAAALTPVFILCRGYAFGTYDHGIHLAYIERARDAGFLPGDPLLAVAARHPSFYFDAFGALSRVLPLEALFFAGYVLSVFAAIAGVRALARSLWPGRAGAWAAALGLAGMLVPRYVAGGLENLDPMLLPRVVSLGPLLYALALGAQGRFLRAFALAGLVFLLHATTASHAAALLWAGCAFAGRRYAHRLWQGPLVFLVAASPLLARMAAHRGAGIPTPAPPAWLDALRLHYPFHHFPAPLELLSLALPAVLAVLLAVAASRWAGPGRLLAGLLAGGLGLLAAGWVGNVVLRSPLTIQLHLLEVGRVLDELAVVSLGFWTFAASRRSLVAGALSLLPTGAYFLRSTLFDWYPEAYPLDHPLLAAALLATLGVGALSRWRRRRALRAVAAPAHPPGPDAGRRSPPRWLGVVLAVGLGGGLLLATGRVPEWRPSGAGQPGYALMRWARDHLPAGAIVAIPPYMKEPLVSFRYFGRRRIVGSWKDGGEGTFDQAFQLAWERELRDVSGIGDTLRVPRESFYWNTYSGWLMAAGAIYEFAPAAHFRDAARLHGATHAVREASALPLPFAELYRDGEYALYDLRR